MRKLFITPLLAIALCFGGCAANQAQVGVQSALTIMAEGVDATGALFVQEMPATSARVQDALVSHVEAGHMTSSEAMAAYIVAMDRWNTVLLSLEVAREVLLVGQSALDIWVSTGELPASWGAFCTDIEDAIGQSITLARVCGIDPPVELVTASRYASEVCLLASDWFAPEGE